ncbi:hypothetical protein ASA1KI_31890 [Opitutales bacterium ASA1]|uniref:PAS domain-containing sensor histidine kinase n=1 Tax=Congregicoccus parvus TaxID=3081749 RepID=UPI002B30EAC3|nr:hypothetical protein ASA1KI_31890 [Opitutales bacterium ASA1]
MKRETPAPASARLHDLRGIPVLAWIALATACVACATIGAVAWLHRIEESNLAARVDRIHSAHAELVAAVLRAGASSPTQPATGAPPHLAEARVALGRFVSSAIEISPLTARVGAFQELASAYLGSEAREDAATTASAETLSETATKLLAASEELRRAAFDHAHEQEDARRTVLVVVLLGAIFSLLLALVLTAWTSRRRGDLIARLLASENDLRESRAALERAQSIGKIGSWTADLRHGTFHTSAEGARLIAWEPGLHTTEELVACIHPDDLDRWRKTWATAMETGHYAIEHRMLVDGTVRWFSVRAEIEKDAAGTPIRATGIMADVTDRRKAELARRETEARLRTFAEHLSDVLWISDPREPRLLYVSPAFEKLWGRPVDDLFADFSLWIAAIHPEDRDRVRTEFFARVAHGLYDTEYRVTRPDASEIWIRDRGFPVHDGAGELVYIAGIAEDITPRKQMERALRESEARFRQLSESLPQLVWGARPDGALDYVNHRWTELTGIPDGRLRGSGWLASVHPQDRDEVETQWLHCVRSGAPLRTETRLRDRNGDYRWFETRAVALLDEHGRITRWFGFHSDIHEARALREELRELNAQLELRVEQRTEELAAANRELEAFSYSVSHDLRAPLRAIDGFSDALVEDYGEALAPEARRYLDLIRRGAQRMGVLIEDLLAFSRLSRQPLDRRLVDMSHVVEDVLGELRGDFEGREIMLEVGPLGESVADPQLVRQVWHNLIANAVKYTRGKTPAHITVSCSEIDGQTTYEVADDGTGFDMRYAHKLFGVFQRLHGEDEFEGTGVGLAIAQRIVHRHGGKIWAHAEVGKGARFFFTLGTGLAAPTREVVAVQSRLA